MLGPGLHHSISSVEVIRIYVVNPTPHNPYQSLITVKSKAVACIRGHAASVTPAATGSTSTATTVDACGYTASFTIALSLPCMTVFSTGHVPRSQQ